MSKATSSWEPLLEEGNDNNTLWTYLTRTEVPGGWLYRTRTEDCYDNIKSESMAFVPRSGDEHPE